MVLLLVLGLALSLATAQINLQTAARRNFNLDRISGMWHLDCIASNNMTRIEENGDLRLFIRNIKPLSNGSLQFDFHLMIQGECVAVTMVCEKTKNNGEFSIAYEGENKVLLLETDYRHYIIFYMQNIKNGTKTHALALYGRFPELNNNYKKEFINTCKLYGLGPQNIIDMAKKVMFLCPKGRLFLSPGQFTGTARGPKEAALELKRSS
ncbi:epididymal-specific lipocalin-9-like [Apodemus sylvaticus]|uniref:epididymal-specific lipocalin-9-like n=1 Tax=Apodemus sylvaticus TaxID=10129 RepID=UPI002243BB30|nr:epididymal-specific lipocalin-9-like [Apodemus sylvaticus]